MTVPQAKKIDDKFIKLSDSIKVINNSLYSERENLKITNELLFKTNQSLFETENSLKQTLMLNDTYLKEIDKYKKMEFEDKKVKQRVTIGLASALIVWLTVFITGINQ